MSIEWTEPATQDVETLVAFILQDDPDTAENVARRIFQTAEQLAALPGLGRPGRVEGTRELLVSRLPYVLVYSDAGNSVRVLRVLHTRQDWPSE